MKYKIILLVLLAGFGGISLADVKAPLTTEIVTDTRAQQIDNYFKERNMPLQGYGKKMVEVADKNGLDWSLLPAIAIRESSGGKQMCSNNPFGWGSCKVTFKSLDEAIETVGYKLGNLKVYKDKTSERKLYYYNGTVVPTYPKEVLNIMSKIENSPL